MSLLCTSDINWLPTTTHALARRKPGELRVVRFDWSMGLSVVAADSRELAMGALWPAVLRGGCEECGVTVHASRGRKSGVTTRYPSPGLGNSKAYDLSGFNPSDDSFTSPFWRKLRFIVSRISPISNNT
eukprot:880333-Pleurochrysis_carterae.AAC.3